MVWPYPIQSDVQRHFLVKFKFGFALRNGTFFWVVLRIRCARTLTVSTFSVKKGQNFKKVLGLGLVLVSKDSRVKI